jgi:hypothetical protein
MVSKQRPGRPHIPSERPPACWGGKTVRWTVLSEEGHCASAMAGMSRVHATRDPFVDGILLCAACGVLAQLGERLICIQEVRSSILLGSTMFWLAALAAKRLQWSLFSKTCQARERAAGGAAHALLLRHPRVCTLGTCLKKVQWTFLPGGARTACGSVAQVVRAHA